jgi:hypothetical protein
VRRVSRLIALLAALFVVAACRSPGPYGYAVTYAATSDEETAATGAREYDPVMVAREPEAWRKGTTSLFGVVTSRAPGPGGAAALTLSVRRLEPRNLCANAHDEDTCRVTVSDRDFGIVHAHVKLRPEDEVGEKSTGVGSLVRVVGQLGEDVDAADGAPILRATYYRHWPRNTYVTKSKADLMKQ